MGSYNTRKLIFLNQSSCQSWRDGSAVEAGVSCLSRGSEFRSQPPTGSSQLLNSGSRKSGALLWPMQVPTHMGHRHTDTQHAHK